MEYIIPSLLVINPFIPGLYSLLDHIGYMYDCLTIRIAYTTAGILINVFYIILYVYIIAFFIQSGVHKGFEHDRKTKLIFSLISTIVLLTIFFLRYYSFKGITDICNRVNKIGDDGDSLLLINIEKTLILVSFLFVLYFTYDCVECSKKFINGKNTASVKLKSLYYSMGFLITLLILRMFELNSLIKEDDCS
jgi:hypothetical protein